MVSRNFMKCENIKLVTFTNLVLMVFLIFDFASALELPVEDGQVYVCPLAKNLEEINPKCECRIDLNLGEIVTSTCGTTTYEMSLTIQEYGGQQYYVIYGFENGGAAVNLKPVAKISGNLEGFVNEKISFSAKDSSDPNDDPLSYEWDFGDGNFASGSEVFHFYTLAGNYLLKLTVSDGLFSSVATTTVSIKERIFLNEGISFLKNKIKEETEKEMVLEEKFSEKEEKTEVLTLEPKETKLKEIVKNGKLLQKNEREEIFREGVETKPKSEKELLLASLITVFKENFLLYWLVTLVLIFGIMVFLKVKKFSKEKQNEKRI